MTNNLDIRSVIGSFFRLQLNVKLIHWNTRNHNLHKITDKLYTDLLGITDRFVETYLGAHGDFEMRDLKPSCIDVQVMQDKDLKPYIQSTIKSLIMSELYDQVSHDLRAILDEMLELLNTNIYLLRQI